MSQYYVKYLGAMAELGRADEARQDLHATEDQGMESFIDSDIAMKYLKELSLPIELIEDPEWHPQRRTLFNFIEMDQAASGELSKHIKNESEFVRRIAHDPDWGLQRTALYQCITNGKWGVLESTLDFFIVLGNENSVATASRDRVFGPYWELIKDHGEDRFFFANASAEEFSAKMAEYIKLGLETNITETDEAQQGGPKERSAEK